MLRCRSPPHPCSSQRLRLRCLLHSWPLALHRRLPLLRLPSRGQVERLRRLLLLLRRSGERRFLPLLLLWRQGLLPRGEWPLLLLLLLRVAQLVLRLLLLLLLRLWLRLLLLLLLRLWLRLLLLLLLLLRVCREWLLLRLLCESSLLQRVEVVRTEVNRASALSPA